MDQDDISPSLPQGPEPEPLPEQPYQQEGYQEPPEDGPQPEPVQPEQVGQPAPLQANRPAENARVVSSDAEIDHDWSGGGDASDFLGLGAMIGGPAADATQPAPDAPEAIAQSWLLDGEDPQAYAQAPSPVPLAHEVASPLPTQPGAQQGDDGNWLLDLDDAQAGQAGAQPVAGGPHDPYASDRPHGLEGSYAEGPPTPNLFTRYAGRVAAALVAVAGGMAGYQLLTKGDELADGGATEGLELSGAVDRGTQLVPHGPLVGPDGDRNGLDRDGNVVRPGPGPDGNHREPGELMVSPTGREGETDPDEETDPRNLDADGLAAVETLDALAANVTLHSLAHMVEVAGPAVVATATPTSTLDEESLVALIGPIALGVPLPIRWAHNGAPHRGVLDPAEGPLELPTRVVPVDPVTVLGPAPAAPEPTLASVIGFDMDGPELTPFAWWRDESIVGAEILEWPHGLYDEIDDRRVAGTDVGTTPVETGTDPDWFLGDPPDQIFSDPPSGDTNVAVGPEVDPDRPVADAGDPVTDAVPQTAVDPGGEDTEPAEPKPGSGLGSLVAALLGGGDSGDAGVSVDPGAGNPVAVDQGAGMGYRLQPARKKGHWYGSVIPLRALDDDERLLTPRVGKVRVAYSDGEAFEGRLHALGQGLVWLDTDLGRMTLEGRHIERIDQLDQWSGNNAADLSGLQKVRVTTPGGIFVGWELNRYGDLVTVVVEGGLRVTLESTEVVPATDRRTTVGITRREKEL